VHCSIDSNHGYCSECGPRWIGGFNIDREIWTSTPPCDYCKQKEIDNCYDLISENVQKGWEKIRDNQAILAALGEKEESVRCPSCRKAMIVSSPRKTVFCCGYLFCHVCERDILIKDDPTHDETCVIPISAAEADELVRGIIIAGLTN